MLREDPTVTKKQIEEIVASLSGDCEFADEVRLARTGALFDHHGDAPLEADALVMETLAHEYRSDLARNQTDGVREVVQQRAALVGLDIKPGSTNEKLIGRAILKEYIRSCEASAFQARDLTCLYPDLAESALPACHCRSRPRLMRRRARSSPRPVKRSWSCMTRSKKRKKRQPKQILGIKTEKS